MPLQAFRLILPNPESGACDPDRDTKAVPAIGGLSVLAAGEAAPHDPFHRGRRLPLTSVRCIRASWEESGRSGGVGDSVASCRKPGHECTGWNASSPAITDPRGRLGSGGFEHSGQDWGDSLRADSVHRGFFRGHDSGESVLSFGDGGRMASGAVSVPLARTTRLYRERCAL